MFYLNFAFAILLIKSYESIIIETTNDQTDQQCDFYNETLVDKVWFVRSPYNCRVYHLCAFYKQFTLTCAEGLFFDENIDSCNFESLVNCQLNSNNLEFYHSKNNQSDASNTNYYYNIDDSAYLDKNSNENSSDEDASDKSGDYATIWPEIEKIILSTLTSTSIPTTNTSTTTSTSTTTTTETISTTTMTSITAKATLPTHWYNNPFSPVTFLLFTYKNNKNYSSSKKYSDILPDKKNIFYNLKSSNYSNTYIVSNQNQQKQQNEHEKSSFSLPSLFEESYEQKDNNKLYDFSFVYNKNLNKEIKKYFDSLIQNTTIAAPTSSNSSRNLKIDLNKNNDYKMNPWWLAPKKCMPGFEHKMIHRENCALYYECNLNGTQIVKACPYPLLFDEFSNSCKPYDIVNCGKRKEAKHLCDYELNNTSNNNNNTPRVKKCSSYPNCRNLVDGLYPTDDCRNYFQCKNERTLRILSCPFDHERNQTLRFNIMTRRCDFIENVPMSCGGYSIQIDIYTGKMKCPIMRSSTSDLSYELKDIYYKHPTKCNLFIECDKENMTILECPNGTHFSPIYQSCVHPTLSNCNPLFSSSLSSSTSISQLSNFDNDEMPNVDKSIASQTNTKLDDSINFNASFEASYSNEDLNESNQEDDYNEDENNNSENDESKSSTFIDTTSTKIINTDSVTISKSKQKTISTISILNENTDDSILPHLNDNFTYIYTTTTTEINKLENDNVIINNSTQVF